MPEGQSSKLLLLTTVGSSHHIQARLVLKMSLETRPGVLSTLLY